ncbi:hypothetical protein MEI_00353 [Bartonella vinsonii subsp. arupensis Pm136co]|uniref:Uncharacterized protein n=1 Tax=Bartonella vinsonii subsp. arupensis Pm136co TaxID=1094561 RepID=A0ABN0GR50_BARVI|nr:hypothetical protein MEI_00353 [Bartonella vinsonii subsp. arupensis Pm136co]
MRLLLKDDEMQTRGFTIFEEMSSPYDKGTTPLEIK